MKARVESLQRMSDLARGQIESRGDGLTQAAAQRVFQRLDLRTGHLRQGTGERLPVCRYLDAVHTDMAAAASPLPEIAAAFAAIEGDLRWMRRKGASPENQPFYDGHANAMLIGPGGLEDREDVMVGVSLMAPHILYPDHDHPPEEVYLAFTDGAWWNAGMDWTEPGPGGLIYNSPGILHAMRSGPKPFLALWMLPL